MSQLKSSTGLFLLVGVLSTLLLAIGSLGLYGIGQSNDALKTVYDDRTVAIGLLGDVQHQLLRSRLLIDASVQDPRPQVIAGNLAELSTTSAVISKTWASYMATYLTQEGEKLAAKFAQDHVQFEQEGMLPAVAALHANDIASVQGLIREKILPLDAQLQLGLEDLMQIQLNVAKQEYQQAVNRYVLMRWASMGAIGAGVLFAILTSLALMRARRQELAMLLELQAHADLVRQKQELAESEFRWRAAIEGVGDGVWDRNIQTGEEIYSTGWKTMLGYAEDDILPNHHEWEGRVHPDDRAAVIAANQAYLTGTNDSCQMEFRQLCKDGSYKWILSRGVIVSRDASGAPLRMIGTHTDITERKQQEEALRLAANVFSHALEGIMITSLDGSIVEVNQAFTQITGYSAEEVVGKTPSLFKSGRHDALFYAEMWKCIERGDVWQGEIWNQRKSGTVYPLHLSISAVTNDVGVLTHYVGAYSDLTTDKAAEQQIHDLAYTDLLTGLPNRRMLLIRLQQAVMAEDQHHRGALLMLGLDNFKNLNDAIGRVQGDEVLQRFAKRLSAAVHDGDTVARLGSDEFVVLLSGLNQDPQIALSQAQTEANKMLEELNKPYQLAGSTISCTASIGVTFFGELYEDTLEPLKRAELAMYQAKSGGRNTLRFFDPQMQAVVDARVKLEAALQEAIQNQQFTLYYQAQVSDSEGIVGVEALVRWFDPKRGMVSPAEFIPLAEETGLILPIGAWVLETACQQLAAWADQPAMAHLSIAVNVSARQFRESNFVSQTLATLERTGANPQRLKLELTESVLIADAEDVIVKMNALKGIGIGFAIDDFGTGYSSLSYIKRLPLERLKIDQSFVRNILMDANDAAISRAVIAMATSMGLGVMAEGVETEAQRDFLSSLGCHTYQGYLFSKPLPVAEFEAFATRFDEH